MGISRREFLYFLGGTGLGAFLENADRTAERLSSIDKQTEFRIKQVRDYFHWLETNNALERFLIDEQGVPWEKSNSILATNKKGDLELVIPYRPEIKHLEAIGVWEEPREESKIRLVTLRAELPNIEKGVESSRLTFIGNNLFEAKMLSDLPPVEYGWIQPATKLWADISKMGMNPSVLEGLRFEVVLKHPALAIETLTYTYVEDDVLLNPRNQSLGPWSQYVTRIDLDEILSTNPNIEVDDLSEISEVSLANDDASREFNYYLI